MVRVEPHRRPETVPKWVRKQRRLIDLLNDVPDPFLDRYFEDGQPYWPPEGHVGVYRLTETGPGVEFEPVDFCRETRLQGANRVVVRDDIGYVAGNHSETVGVYEGIPADPSLRSVLKATLGGGPNGLALDGDCLFVGTGSMIEVYDVSTASCPAIAGSISDQQQLRGPGSAHDMGVEGGDLFVTAQQSDRLVRYHVDR